MLTTLIPLKLSCNIALLSNHVFLYAPNKQSPYIYNCVKCNYTDELQNSMFIVLYETYQINFLIEYDKKLCKIGNFQVLT